MSRTLFALIALVYSFIAFSETISIAPGEGFHTRLQEALIVARPGSTIELPAGTYHLKDEVISAKSHITIRGQGMGVTVLDFSQQQSGAQGILATGDAFTIEDLSVQNSKGDGIKVEGANGVVFRRVRVEWTRGPHKDNGGYGIYPVQTQNVLVEYCHIRGASDAGVYVGQSRNIVVRYNYANHNVAGIEIENSRYADVYGNEVTENTAGILVFDLPNLKHQGGKQTRVFNNTIHSNNTRNFAPKGNIVGIVPAGTGFMVMANDDVEIFENKFYGHKLTNIAIINYLITQIPIKDPNYDPLPQRIYIHDNIMDKRKFSFLDGGQMNLLANALFMFKIPDIVYDGISDGTYTGKPFPDHLKICIENNQRGNGDDATFGNMHLDNQRKLNPFPGGPVTKDLSPHNCAHEPLPEVVLAPWPDVPHVPADPYTEEEILKICNRPGEGVNWDAFVVNCPELRHYRLFVNQNDPTQRPNQGGVKYDLTTPLFSDYAKKDRFLFLPPGTTVDYSRDKIFKFPLGTILTKTFSYYLNEKKPHLGKMIVETRLLIKRESGWVAIPYIWTPDMTTAEIGMGGHSRTIVWRNHKGKKKKVHYKVPSLNKCTSCHQGVGGDEPIGLKAKWLNRNMKYDRSIHNQLEEWEDRGLLTNLPDEQRRPQAPVWDNEASGTVHERARAYLDINCAHCHSPTGRARFSGLFLDLERSFEDIAAGKCKAPIAAGIGAGGLPYDITPGKPKKSIVWFRMNSTHPAIVMPELGRTLVHKKGVKLIKKWIKDMPKEKCSK